MQQNQPTQLQKIKTGKNSETSESLQIQDRKYANCLDSQGAL